MSTTQLIRWSGLALLMGGLLLVAGQILVKLGPQQTDSAIATSPLFLLSGVLGVVGGLLVALGLPALFVRQRERMGLMGLVGYVCLFFTVLLLLVGTQLAFTLVWPWLASNPATQPMLRAEPPASFLTLFIIGSLLNVVGAVLFGLATIRAGILPRAAAVLFILGALLSGTNFFVQNDTLDFISSLAENIAGAWFGFALWSAMREPMASVEPSAAAQRSVS